MQELRTGERLREAPANVLKCADGLRERVSGVPSCVGGRTVKPGKGMFPAGPVWLSVSSPQTGGSSRHHGYWAKVWPQYSGVPGSPVSLFLHLSCLLVLIANQLRSQLDQKCSLDNMLCSGPRGLVSNRRRTGRDSRKGNYLANVELQASHVSFNCFNLLELKGEV